MGKYMALCILCLCCTFGNAAERKKTVLIAITSGTQLHVKGSTVTLGYWGEELTAPLRAMENAGIAVEFASPKGTALLDPSSVDPRWSSSETVHLVKETDARLRQEGMLKLADAQAQSYDAILVVGGHGAMFDLNRNPDMIRLLRRAYAEKKIVAAECHGTGALAFAGLIKNVPVTGFPEAWEPAELKDSLPYSLETELAKASGGKYLSGLKEGEAPKPLVIVSGRIITSRDPMSSLAMGEALVKALGK